MQSVKFSSNWNNKLSCSYFTTIRGHRPAIYEGIDVELYLNEKFLGMAQVINKRTIEFGKIPVNIVMMDTGYTYTESQKLFCNFLKCKSILELNKKIVDVIFLKLIKK